MRVTVIATGFPEGPAVRATTPSFNTGTPTQRIVAPKKDVDVPPASPRLAREEAEKKPEIRSEKPSAPTKIEEKNEAPAETSTADEDPWGGLPSFLRRK